MQITIAGNLGATEPPPPPPLEPPPPPPVFDYVGGNDVQFNTCTASASAFWPSAQPFYGHYQAAPNVFLQPSCSANVYGEARGVEQLYVPMMGAGLPSPYTPSFSMGEEAVGDYSTFTHLIDPPPPPPILSAAEDENNCGDSGCASRSEEPQCFAEADYVNDDCCGGDSTDPLSDDEPIASSLERNENVNDGETTADFQLVVRRPTDDIRDNAFAFDRGMPFRELSAEERALTSRSQFTGRVCFLPKGCGRPQTSEGRSFPLKQRSPNMYSPGFASEYFRERDYERVPFSAVSSVLPHLRKRGAQEDSRTSPLLIRTATKLVRKAPTTVSLSHLESLIVTTPISSLAQRLTVGTPFTTLGTDGHTISPRGALTISRSSSSLPVLISSPAAAKPSLSSGAPNDTPTARGDTPTGIKKVMSNGTLSRNGMSWRRRRTNEGLNETANNVADRRTVKVNRKLRRINDQLFTEDSNECFEFAQHGRCKSGVFCMYEHGGNTDHHNAKICARLLRGQCRQLSCKFVHGLEAHQMPVCYFYLRMMCTNDCCAFLHVKHSPHCKPCEAFNRGVCERGIECRFPHRYFQAVIRKRCDPASFHDRQLEDVLSEIEGEKTSVELKEDCEALKWIV